MNDHSDKMSERKCTDIASRATSGELMKSIGAYDLGLNMEQLHKQEPYRLMMQAVEEAYQKNKSNSK